MTEAEIAGYMGWRGPGAYTDHLMRRIRVLVVEVQKRERRAVLDTVDELRGAERERNSMFSDGYDHALGHIEEFVRGRNEQQQGH